MSDRIIAIAIIALSIGVIFNSIGVYLALTR